MKRKLVQGLLVGAVAALVALGLYLGGTLERLEAVTWDLRARLFAKAAPASEDIVLVFLDQASLTWAEQALGIGWPWPRSVYGAILGFCKAGGARAVAFDVLYTEASEHHVSEDDLLGAAIADGVPFVGTVFFEDGDATFPVAQVATNASILGSVLGDADPDGVTRRMRLGVGHDGTFYYTLGLAVAALEEPPEASQLPLDRQGRLILRWRGPSQTYPTLSAQAVVQSYLRLQEGGDPTVDPAVVDGKYVLFGFTAPGLMDLRSTPMSPVYPGVEVHATALDNLLTRQFMRELSRTVSGLWIVLLGVAAGTLSRRTDKARKMIGWFVVFLPLPIVVAAAGYLVGWWIPLVAPLTSVALGLVGSVVLGYAMEGRQKRFIKGAFKQYLSPHVIESLLADPDRLKLGGELRELSIFFSDIQGFTSLSEGLDPETLTALLNTYLTAMTDIILDEGGTVDKYEGDAIIAFWNAPVDQPDHPVRAVRAGLRCQARLAELQPQFRERVGKDMACRIGLNTGPVVVGNMGSDQRFDYTFLGDAGNLASRLEGVNKQFGSFILMSGFTAERLDDAVAWREVSRVAVVGRREPVTVFEPMLPETAAARAAWLPLFDRARDAYYAGAFREARAGFEALADRDPVSARYAARCKELEGAPPAAWNGVWAMTEK